MMRSERTSACFFFHVSFLQQNFNGSRCGQCGWLVRIQVIFERVAGCRINWCPGSPTNACSPRVLCTPLGSRGCFLLKCPKVRHGIAHRYHKLNAIGAPSGSCTYICASSTHPSALKKVVLDSMAILRTSPPCFPLGPASFFHSAYLVCLPLIVWIPRLEKCSRCKHDVEDSHPANCVPVKHDVFIATDQAWKSALKYLMISTRQLSTGWADTKMIYGLFSQ